jgi:hypothetical protein
MDPKLFAAMQASIANAPPEALARARSPEPAPAVSPVKRRKRTTVENSVWCDIGSDAGWSDHGGLWARKIPGRPGHYLVMRFENCADWGDGNDDKTYHVELSECSLDNPQLAQALECCDIEPDGLDDYGDPKSPEAWELERIYALHRYGAHAPMFQETGRNVWKLIRAAKRDAALLCRDAREMAERLERPVNAIGSTAAEYAIGDLQSPILRGVMNGDPKAELMLRLGMAQHDGTGK